MSYGWERSDLQIGEELKMPDEMFESKEGQYRLVSARYVGETETGIRVMFEYKPPIGSERVCIFEQFISWNKIWCGETVIKRQNGTLVRARRRENLLVTQCENF